MLKRIYLLLFLSIFLVACNGSNIKKKAINLDERIKQYNIALRWAMYDKLDKYHLTQEGEKKLIDRDLVENFRITSYKIRDKTVNEDISEATVKGEISYYNNEVGTLKKMPYEQIWWYDADIKVWFVESDFPVFK